MARQRSVSGSVVEGVSLLSFLAHYGSECCGCLLGFSTFHPRVCVCGDFSGQYVHNPDSPFGRVAKRAAVLCA